ncbi:MAG: hypothetical protein VB143_03970 [Burkholderia sp.]
MYIGLASSSRSIYATTPRLTGVGSVSPEQAGAISGFSRLGLSLDGCSQQFR